MPEISVDAHELRSFAVDMTRMPGVLSRHAVPVLSRGALNIKRQMAADFEASGNAGFRHVGRTVSYDLTTDSATELSAEIGPDKPSGALANVAVFGTSRGGGTVPDPREALDAEAPRFEKAIGDLVEEVWGG